MSAVVTIIVFVHYIDFYDCFFVYKSLYSDVSSYFVTGYSMINEFFWISLRSFKSNGNGPAWHWQQRKAVPALAMLHMTGLGVNLSGSENCG